MPWTQLLQQCSRCLTDGELARLEGRWQGEQRRWANVGLPGTFASNRTVDQALGGDVDLSVESAPSQAPLLIRSRLATTSVNPVEARPMPWAIPESVFFVYRDEERIDTLAPRTPAATAFVVSVPGPRGGVVRFLVTARHAVDPQWAHCDEPDPESVDVRFNRRSGGVGYETISLRSGGIRRFFTPSDPTADLAIIPLDQALGPRLEEYKFIDTPFRMLPTGPEKQLFHPGLPVVTARLPQMQISSDEPYLYPVFNTGTLATMPAASIEVRCGRPDEAPDDRQLSRKPLHLWLIDGGIPRGVSGAPVYTKLIREGEIEAATVLLGIQSVTWPDKGIAGITPSTVLADLIRSTLHQNNVSANPHRGFPPRQQESLASLY